MDSSIEHQKKQTIEQKLDKISNFWSRNYVNTIICTQTRVGLTNYFHMSRLLGRHGDAEQYVPGLCVSQLF